jgi:hypothetical protein
MTAMSVTMIRATIRPDRVADIEAEAQKMFAAINEARPIGVRYASCRVADTDTFVVLLAIEDGLENPLAEVAAFRAFQGGLGDAMAGPPAVEQLDVVGSYRLF